MLLVARGVDEHGVTHLVEVEDRDLAAFARVTASRPPWSALLFCLNYMRWMLPVKWAPNTATPTCLRCVSRMMSNTMMRRRPDGAITCVWDQARSP